ncbi:MAG: GNAT family N-acetyltransferase [Bryobacteraceae bacterium]
MRDFVRWGWLALKPGSAKGYFKPHGLDGTGVWVGDSGAHVRYKSARFARNQVFAGYVSLAFRVQGNRATWNGNRPTAECQKTKCATFAIRDFFARVEVPNPWIFSMSVKQIGGRHPSITSSATSSAQLVQASSPEWNEYLSRVPHDFFQTAKYHAFSATANSEAWLLLYGNHDKFVAWPYLLQPISDTHGRGTQFQDVTSVYGYSGPVVHNCEKDEAFLVNAWEACVEAWRAQMAVSVFTRFNPILGNEAWLRPEWKTPGVLGHTYKEGKTVAIDLSKSPDEIWADYQRKLRQHVRRVEREQEFTTVHDPEWEHLDEFISMYYATLQRNNAAAFYFFSRDYFMALKEALGEHGSLFLCMWDGAVGAALLLIEYGGIVSVHLAASDDRCSALSPNKWLFHAAQLLARSRGNKFFHIGGGRGSRDDDPLFRFKAMFSSTHLPFYTGRWVLDAEAYDFLTAERRREAELQGGSYLAPTYFPIYRAPVINAQTPTPGSSSSEQG